MLSDLLGHNGGPALDESDLITKWGADELAWMEWQARWALTRRPNQIAPTDDDWVVWNLLAGRGFGKTRTAGENLSEWAIMGPDMDDGGRWLVTAPTASDLRGTCFEGESGLLNIIPKELQVSYNKSLFELKVKTLSGGVALIKGISAEEPERFRGPQFRGGWADELAAWKYLQAAWDMIMFTMRLGDRPRIIVSTTPRPKPLISQMAANKLSYKVVTTRGSSHDNLANLAPTYRDQLMQYEGTQLGRQEIYGEIIDPEEAGIVKRSWFGLWPHNVALPAFDEIVMSLDTAFTEESRSKETGDPDFSACTVWGIWHSKPLNSEPDRPPQLSAMLIDAWDERLGLPDLITRVKEELKSRYGGDEQRPVIKPQFGPRNLTDAGRTVDTAVIEEKGSGISLIQMLARENIFVRPYNPGRADKLARLHGVSHIAHAGVLYVMESAKDPGRPVSWAEAMLAQVCTFAGKGTIAHDDYVDSFTQAVRYIVDSYRVSVTVKPKPEEFDPETDRRISNPYGN
jgi:predicted phage terminase large subunit-like protein